ncbi:MAG: hypothetical protein OXU70_04420 [Gammaproteobacteria bacterium]|nr:hypothetical protein [Gammaproteobacteria bacterium]
MDDRGNDPLAPLEAIPVETIELVIDLLRDLADAIDNRHCARLINAQRRRERQPGPFDDGRPAP